jgi:hypothetical protein
MHIYTYIHAYIYIHTYIHTYIRMSHEAKFKQDAKPPSKHSGEDAIYGMGGLIRT